MGTTIEILTRLRDARSRDATGTTSQFTAALVKDQKYRICGEVSFWYKFAATTGAVVAGEDDSIYVPAGVEMFDTPVDASKLFLHVIRSSVTGKVNIARVEGS